jgi:uncharacterized protein DUF5658
MLLVRQFRLAIGLAEQPIDPQALLTLMRCLAAVVVLNLIDAALTIWQVKTQPGFADLNPLVQSLIATGHPAGIAVLKLGTLAFASVVLLTYYTRRSAQLACRAALLITLWVYVHWAIYLAGYIAHVT